LSDFDILLTTEERTDSSNEEIIHVSGVHNSFTMQTNTLQVDDLITNKCMEILEAPRRILNTQCDNISVLPNVKNF
jgi:hypothetical protein